MILGAVADGLLPFHTWYKAKTGKDCEDCRPSRLGVLEFVESLISQWDAPPTTARLWNRRVRAIEAAPLQYCPIENPDEWRRARGLDASPKFDLFRSQNQDRDRVTVYGQNVPAVVACAKARLGPRPWADDELEKFAAELSTDRCPNWPTGTGLRSMFFAEQFLKDILAALMSMQRIGSPRPFALLEAMHEYRRVGNRYTVTDAEAAVAAFKREFDRAMGGAPS